MRFIFTIILVSLLQFSLRAQHIELGAFVGATYYVGELNPGTPFVNEPNPFIGVIYRKNLSKRYALRYGFNYGKIGASDEALDREWNGFRELSFSSSIIELSGILEFNFFPYQINNYNTMPFTPYTFIGVAAFRINPSVEYYPSGAETERGSVIAPSIPFGLGFKFDFFRNLGVNIEWGLRKTFTDEIDGLPATYENGFQLSNSQNNDWYSFAGISLNYKILTKSDRCPVAK